uniref:Uncharacterized protein n=1 Tax=Parasteatoda tepidariorum TaxID=114398 RepID=A0A2L2YI61_PARTP
MGEDVGIFIRFQDTDVELVIRGCKEILENVDGSNVFITGVMRDRKYGGFRVYFSEESVVEDFLKLKYLPLSDERASIHSLTTKLTVHDVMPDSETDFKEMLQNQLESFDLKPVLDICSIPVSKEFPTIRSGNWLLELDIPEIEDLGVFRNSGLPDNMKLSLTFRAKKREKRVSFFCCLCHDIEHSRGDCPKLVITQTRDDRGSARTSPESYARRNAQRFEIRERSPSASTSTAKRIRIESIIGNLPKQNNGSAQKSASFGKVKIKQEPEDYNACSRLNPRVVLKRASVRSENDYDTESYSKKMRFSGIDENPEARFDGSPAASSTTGRDSPVIVYESPRRSSSTDRRFSEDSSLPYDREDGCQDDSNALSFNLPTSSQPEMNSERNFNDFYQKEASDISDSGETIRAPRRKKPVYAPVVLPKRIKEIINTREKKQGELTIVELEAFFNHVKKKMSPAKVAKQFTDDVQCLKAQLKWIVQQYYMTPKAGTGEDSRFMKWLEGMLDRFDSVPSKRKKLKTEPED